MPHLVFDVYNPSILEAYTRSKHGQGGRNKVTKKNTVPSNRRNILRHSDNRVELFQLFVKMIAQMLAPYLVIVTNGPAILSTHEIVLHGKDNCSHREVYLYMSWMLQSMGARLSWLRQITQMLLSLHCVFPTFHCSVFAHSSELGLEQLWVTFRRGQSFLWISVHGMCNYMGQKKITGISFLHAFTGCDTVSTSRNKGMQTTWQTLDICPEASSVFSKLSQCPLTVEDGNTEIPERFVILMYGRSSTAATVDEVRLDMFARKQRPDEAIPPTRAALL